MNQKFVQRVVSSNHRSKFVQEFELTSAQLVELPTPLKLLGFFCLVKIFKQWAKRVAVAAAAIIDAEVDWSKNIYAYNLAL